MNKKVLLELIWWVFTAVVVIGVLLPIYTNVEGYPFYFINIVYVVTFITLTRYIFLLRYTFLAKRERIKLILFFLSIPFVFYLGQELNHFQTFLDEEGLNAVTGFLPLSSGTGMIQYIQNEILLFGVGSIICAVVFPFRLMVSIWRFRNKGTV